MIAVIPYSDGSVISWCSTSIGTVISFSSDGNDVETTFGLRLELSDESFVLSAESIVSYVGSSCDVLVVSEPSDDLSMMVAIGGVVPGTPG